MWDSIFKFLGPILQSVLSTAGSEGIKAGVGALTAPKAPPSPGHGMPSGLPAQGAGLMPGAPPGISGSGTNNNPSGTMNFGGGYTGGPATSGIPAGQPSSGFQTMGFPSQDQAKLKQGLMGNEGFKGI